MKCDDCGREIVGEPWELEDGRTVCGGCCARDLRGLVTEMTELRDSLRQENARLRERLRAAKGQA